jgi:hypothetical protein
VIVLPDAAYGRMRSGLGTPAAPPEYTGGMTPRGVSHLYDFVERGGTLVTLDSATELPIVDFGLALHDVTVGASNSTFYVPGTLLDLEVDTSHPVAHGMPERAAAFFARSPAFDLESDDDRESGALRPAVIARSPGKTYFGAAGSSARSGSPAGSPWSTSRWARDRSCSSVSAHSIAVSLTGPSSCC